MCDMTTFKHGRGWSQGQQHSVWHLGSCLATRPPRERSSGILFRIGTSFFSMCDMTTFKHGRGWSREVSNTSSGILSLAWPSVSLWVVLTPHIQHDAGPGQPGGSDYEHAQGPRRRFAQRASRNSRTDRNLPHEFASALEQRARVLDIYVPHFTAWPGQLSLGRAPPMRALGGATQGRRAIRTFLFFLEIYF